MRVPLNWLRDYVDVELDPADLAERLTVLGMEVKGLERWGADWQNVVVGELLEVRPHPNADRLSLTRVTLGDGSEPLEIVCGATNIAPGQRVPVALAGAVLPGERRIERTQKMGVVSNGMLCSGEELRMTADGDSILILPPETPLGGQLTELYGDWVLDVDVKPNRGDALCLVGLAREVAALTREIVRFPDTTLEEAGRPVTERLSVEVRAPDLCPRFVGRWVSGVRVGPSPDAIQMRLLAAGVRPVSNVVDASNYVLLELGKPIHTFDATAIGSIEGRARIIVRRAEPGERLETLDHVERELTPETLLIADPSGPLGLAGVMGGAASEVGDATTEVAVESAIFDPVSIRRTAFHYALRSEASLRFEKGQEFRLARIGADRTAGLIREWAGGAIAPGVVDTNPVEPEPIRVAFRPARVNRLLGTAIEPDQQQALLGRVGIRTETSAAGSLVTIAAAPAPLFADPIPGEAVDAIVPSWRRDIAIEADVAEEVGRLAGYETIPPVTPDTEMPVYRPDPLEVRDHVRGLLVGAGLHEVVTYALVSERHVDTFPAPDQPVVAPIRLRNPLSRDHALLRESLLGSLLEVVGGNRRHGREDVPVFEIGKGYGRTADGLPTEWWRLGIALAGFAAPEHWADRRRAWDLDDLKGLVELVAGQLGLERPTYEPLTDDPTLHPGRSARVSARSGLDTVGIGGRIGELHPGLIEAWDLRVERALVAELRVAGLDAGSLPRTRVVPPPRVPAVERDLAVVVPESLPAAVVETAIRDGGGTLLAEHRLFDIYRGTPLAPDEKSLAWRLVFSADRTLTDDEIEAALADVTSAVSAVGGRIRT